MNSNSNSENIKLFFFLPKIRWVRHQFEFELRKFYTFTFPAKIAWVPHELEFEFELRKF